MNFLNHLTAAVLTSLFLASAAQSADKGPAHPVVLISDSTIDPAAVSNVVAAIQQSLFIKIEQRFVKNTGRVDSEKQISEYHKKGDHFIVFLTVDPKSDQSVVHHSKRPKGFTVVLPRFHQKGMEQDMSRRGRSKPGKPVFSGLAQSFGLPACKNLLCANANEKELGRPGVSGNLCPPCQSVLRKKMTALNFRFLTASELMKSYSAP